MITIQCKARFQRGRRRGKAVTEVEALPQECPGRVPRVARLMALAIRFEQMIRDGEVSGYAELARRGRVSRARGTQIMNMLGLAPDIQEEILYLPWIGRGSHAITERQLRPMAAQSSWREQEAMWRARGPLVDGIPSK